MQYERMPIESESPESLGYDSIDCNLAESSVRDARFKDIGLHLDELVIAYGDHIGKPALRKLIAGFYPGVADNNVLLTAGAAAGLFMIHTALLQNGDHLIVVRPNYASNIATPRAIGCECSYIDLSFDENFELDVEKVRHALRPNTRLISITTPHNPTGTVINRRTLEDLCQLAESHHCLLLVDETYRDLSFQPLPPLAASISSHAISVSSVSKAYGIPGIRLGWLITKNPQLQELFLAAKEQIYICNSIVDEEIGYQYLLKKDDYFGGIKKEVQVNFDRLKKWMKDHAQLEWVEPVGGVVCFPRFKDEIALDVEKFYNVLLQQYKTYLGPGHWFEQSKRYFRLGFGWETPDLFVRGLNNIDRAIQQSISDNR